MRKIISLSCLLVLSGSLFAQTSVAPKQSKPIEVQRSSAQDALVSIYTDYQTSNKKINDILQGARSELDKVNKPIQDKIDPLQKQIDANNQKAIEKYNKDAFPIINKVQSYKAQIEALSEVVKKDQKLPNNAYFDIEKGSWVVPADPVTPESKVKH